MIAVEFAVMSGLLKQRTAAELSQRPTVFAYKYVWS